MRDLLSRALAGARLGRATSCFYGPPGTVKDGIRQVLARKMRCGIARGGRTDDERWRAVAAGKRLAELTMAFPYVGAKGPDTCCCLTRWKTCFGRGG